MHAFLIGATGLVGSRVLQILVDSPDYVHIIAPVRRSTEVRSEKVLEIPFDAEGAADLELPVSIDHVFCAIGTTKKKAGGMNAMEDVDVRFPSNYAERLKTMGARHFSLVSAMGADWESSVPYNAMKGRLEERIRMMRFPSTSVFRPSVLGGHREGDIRPSEAWAQRAMAWLPKSLKTIPAERVAAAMVAKALEEKPGMEIIRSGKIWAISESLS